MPSPGPQHETELTQRLRLLEAELPFLRRALLRHAVPPADAEDVAQDTVLVAARRWTAYDPARPLPPAARRGGRRAARAPRPPPPVACLRSGAPPASLPTPRGRPIWSGSAWSRRNARASSCSARRHSPAGDGTRDRPRSRPAHR